MNAPPSAKFLFIWQLRNLAKNDMQAAITACLDMGLSGVSIKVAHNCGMYNLRWTGSAWVDDILPPFVTALHDAGLKVHGWQWVDGNDPTGEALRAVQRIRQLSLDGFEIDAEGTYKGKYLAATIYARELRTQCPTLPIGLTSYRYPSLHPTLPWLEFLRYCDYHLPQVYFNPTYPPNYGPVPELIRSVNELRSKKDIPIFPAGRAYIGDGHPNPTPAEMNAFMSKAVELGLPGFTFWNMDSLYLHPGGASRMQAIKDFRFTCDDPSLTLEERVTSLENRVTALEQE